MRENLHIAIRAAIDGGLEIMKVYATDFDVELKGDNSPLTIADQNANDVINKFLEPTGIPIISEENKQTDYEVRRNWNQCWIVDPLDGTKEFVKRNGEFTVNIALVIDGNPVLGVIYVPVEKSLYFTSEDITESMKVIVNDPSISIDEILRDARSIKPAEEIVPPVKVVGSRSHLNDDTRKFIENIEKETSVEIVSRGSSLKFCLVAEGDAHIYPRYAPTMEWDTAAGQAICQAAGIRVVEEATGTPLKYNKENLLNPYFLVAR
ncbi:MAG: 3'(2'),5'-bisphosphate nucleotidase CysQ [Bacteroidia bacterium]|nr:3'(2'),5'-bisphosphate nucleotidase CysQ [Bacteroidia bacterium]NNF30510.1 3'(2'),5'-bisphosphate nucleotidase CysQ [Flavobacteriaceae bacterium]MBT8276512.1 3'(2'),5'-bisphosphate nucleotidase CysQ [Bacteroidia bacterium]NNJ82229.1 3'(2'),5'-bisphosphate nucleotidase CysQ [Flavobacteriaceae bacterium]NNK53842.1 3'(2'),5'-bisphosphate nucleotidase CysQ [Flavobacteriaceae bacterium]